VIARAASAPVRDDRGTIVGAVHVVHDVTDEYIRTQQAAQGARLRSLGQLAGGVAHDLNQYLGMVVGYGDLALSSLDGESIDVDGVRDSVSTMIRAAVNKSGLILPCSSGKVDAVAVRAPIRATWAHPRGS